MINYEKTDYETIVKALQLIGEQLTNLSKEINFSKWWKQFSKFGALIFFFTSETNTSYNSSFI